MQRTPPQRDARTEAGRKLARELYDYKLGDLRRLRGDQAAALHTKYPSLGEAEFEDVLNQVISAKQYQQELTGWQAAPHDIAILVFVIVTWLVNLRIGVVAGVGVLVLLESLFQVLFDRDLYRVVAPLVWLTYPAYVFLAYLLFQRGYALVWIALAVVAAWAGSYLLGMLARLPLHLILQARAEGAEMAAKRRGKQK